MCFNAHIIYKDCSGIKKNSQNYLFYSIYILKLHSLVVKLPFFLGSMKVYTPE